MKQPGERFVVWALELACAPLTSPHQEGPAPPFKLFVLVTPDGRSAAEIVAEFLQRRGGPAAAAALARRGAVWHGRSLAAALACDPGNDRPRRLVQRLARRPLVVIDAADGLGGIDERQGVLHLLDACAASGATVCVSLPDHPQSVSGLDAAVASRLSGGLVVLLSAATRPPAGGVGAGGTVTLPRVLRLVARHHELDVATLVGPRRSRSIAAARSLAMYLARLVTGKSLQAIGTGCGGRDHTTVLHATRTVAARLGLDPAFAADVARLVETLSRGRRPGRGRRSDTSADEDPPRGHHAADGGMGHRPAPRRRHAGRRRSRGRHSA